MGMLLLLGGGCASDMHGSSPAALAPAITAHDVAVDGKALHFVLRQGAAHAPVVVMEAGATLDSSEWSVVIDRLALCTDATLVAYDRAGMGRSTPLTSPYDIEQEVRRLHAALGKQHLSGRLLLVGHSFGGYLIQLYAHHYPGSVVGAVYVDANTVEGIGGTTGARALITPIQEAGVKGSKAFNDMRMAENYVETTAHMARVPPPKGIPVTVITRGAEALPSAATEAERRWRAGHVSLVKATGGRLVFAPDTGHFIPTDRPDLVAGTIMTMLDGLSRVAPHCLRD